MAVLGSSTASNARSKMLRRAGWGAVVLLIAMVIVAATTLRLFYWSGSALPESADAIVVVAAGMPRVERALELADAGHAPLVLVSDGGDHSSLPDGICDGPTRHYVVKCFTPAVANTRGEARAATEVIEAEGLPVDHVIVVSSRYHVTRAGILLRRCLGAKVYAATIDQKLPWAVWRSKFIDEWLALGHTLSFGRGC